MFISSDNQRSHEILLQLMQKFKSECEGTEEFRNEFLFPGSVYRSRDRYTFFGKAKSQIVCTKEKNGSFVRTALQYDVEKHPVFFDQKIQKQFDTFVTAFSIMFYVGGNHMVNIGNFFDRRFKMTSSVEQVLSLQDSLPIDAFVGTLWRTISWQGGIGGLYDIYLAHMDRIEYELRFRYPGYDLSEGITLVPSLRLHSHN